MSNAVSALNGAIWSDGIADVAEEMLQGMITLRADLNAPAVKKAVKAASGVALPGPGQARVSGDGGLCWMSPDEVLILCPYDAVDETLAKMHIGLAKAHALAVDVSDARAVFRVSGENAREVMAKLAPVDFSPEAFGPGTFRRSRMAQVAAAFWMSDEKTFQIVCFRSQAQYVFDLLRGAAQKGNAADFFR